VTDINHFIENIKKTYSLQGSQIINESPMLTTKSTAKYRILNTTNSKYYNNTFTSELPMVWEIIIIWAKPENL